MEPNKLEQDFKQKLEQRTIQPTEMAWDRLDAMLSVTEEKKKKPSRTWMYMAASFLALLLVGSLFLNQESQNTKNGITTDDNRITEGKSEQKTSVGESFKPTVIDSESIKQEETVAVTTTTVSNNKPAAFVNNKTTVVKKETAKNEIAPMVNKDAVAATIGVNDAVKVKTGPAKITVDAANLLASVESTAVTEQMAATGKPKKQSVKVDSNSLLTSVEGELNESFRGKVLQSVAKNYNIIKSSVASRNHE
ncbi:hypothetical protein Q765_11145 [Flavobacterium rivuli WB 3.3-2 = DSM 21788]|uniref:Uncharacterized protein n=1 Tax=Flavobacterium rivuli WB 3.3-2 = DSM 21788 TaxID=1121895 RepID=A0A0A2M4P0_9FLAO|nr:hypothetical protein [Flavobacterium rivuli]KGO86428.1 hypothetical protein Q765_11145 [Flavobacterium rivuli WB 3.3-2 = DSM 21788]